MIFSTFTCEATRWLAHVTQGNKRARAHGDSYRIDAGPVSEWVAGDFQEPEDGPASFSGQLGHPQRVEADSLRNLTSKNLAAEDLSICGCQPATGRDCSLRGLDARMHLPRGTG